MPLTAAEKAKNRSKIDQWPHYHHTFHERSVVPPRYSASDAVVLSLTERVTSWFWPWTLANYPGRRKAFLSLLCRPVSWSAVRHWKHGRNRLPADIALGLAEMIRSRIAAGQALIEELEAYAAGHPGRSAGFRAVDPVTGRDKRHRAGNRPKAVELPDSDAGV